MSRVGRPHVACVNNAHSPGDPFRRGRGPGLRKSSNAPE